MIEEKFDEDWFSEKRSQILASCFTEQARLHQRMRVPYVLGVQRPQDTQARATACAQREQIFQRMAPVQSAALRSHLETFQTAMESAGLTPAYDLGQELLLVEWLWHSSPLKKFYRDHLSHVLKVASLGSWLLKQSLLEEKPLHKSLGQRLAEGSLGCPALRAIARRQGVSEQDLQNAAFWSEAVREATRIGCLLHDLGYAAQIQHAMAFSVRQASPFHPLPLAVHADEHWAWEKLHRHLMSIPFTGGHLQSSELTTEQHQLACTALQKTHSLTSGLRILDLGREADEHWRLHSHELFVLEWAALAATTHDLAELWIKYPKEPSQEKNVNVQMLRPSFTRDPVSYIVALADNLQDFDRIHLVWKTTDPTQTTVTACHIYQSVKLEINASQAEATFYLSEDAAGPNATEQSRTAAWTEAKKFKDKDAENIFGPQGWLDHGELFSKFTIKVEPPTS